MLKEYFKKHHRDLVVRLDIGIFQEIKQMKLKSVNHRGYIFGFMWLTHYLWRHGMHLERDFTIKDIKTILGRSPVDKHIDYITKRKGLLDELGYTEYSIDYPVNANIDGDGILQFTMLSDLDLEHQKQVKSFKARGYNVKKPLLGYQRSRGKGGLFFSKEDAFDLSVEEYVRCMQIDVDAFYLYGWIKMRQKLMGNSKVGIRTSDFKEVTGYGEVKIRELLKSLEAQELIKVTRTTSKINESILTLNDYEIIK